MWIRWFRDIGVDDIGAVGGKNASLGELLRELGSLGIRVPNGFAVTVEAYRHFLRSNGLEDRIRRLLADVDMEDLDHVVHRAEELQAMIVGGGWDPALREAIVSAYALLSEEVGVDEAYVAVRSSATSEDLPEASFAGQQETYLMVRGAEDLLHSVKKAFASLFTPRAMVYRHQHGFAHDGVALSVGIQHMVRSDLAASGVMFTLDTESGFDDVVMINGSWGLGELLVQGNVVPDEYYVHKPTLRRGYRSLILRRMGEKARRMVYDVRRHRPYVEDVPEEDRKRYCIGDDEALQLASWALAIEEHYSNKHGRPTPMDIEWAKDGLTGALYIVQARPETVHSRKDRGLLRLYRLMEQRPALLQGIAVGNAIAQGKVRILHRAEDMIFFEEGEVLVTEMTDPDWVPIMQKASAIITNQGGRTSHAAIVARELGIPAVVGTSDATEVLRTGQAVTVSTAEGETGMVYDGLLRYKVEDVDTTKLPKTQTKIYLNIGNPEEAFRNAQLPADGVGLARMEFIFASWMKIHPLALLHYDALDAELRAQIDALTWSYADKASYFVDTLSQGIAVIAAAFYPRKVILRFSDFKSNEYAHLIGGTQFEPSEENPMLGWRGASRYYSDEYREAFLLEVQAVRRVREEMGLDNLQVMVPFCRTPEEAERVLEVIERGGLKRGERGLEIFMMAEIPSNVLLIEEFSKFFDGFSIGSNDLTQFVLGVDRDSGLIAHLFDERHIAVRTACKHIIEGAHRMGKVVGICGQAPSDYADFTEFLVRQGIDSISVNPDALLKTLHTVAEVEALQSAHREG